MHLIYVWMKYAANSCRHVQMSATLAIHPFFSRKLLKMHEAKYEPMDKVDEKEKEQCLIFLLQVDAEKIMEEILGMKAGLNPDQQVILKLMLASCWHILI